MPLRPPPSSSLDWVVIRLKLPKALKTRIVRLARRAGVSPHAFMVRLLTERVEDVGRFEQFVAEARQADQRMQASGAGYASDVVHEYLEAKAAGQKANRPKPVQSRK